MRCGGCGGPLARAPGALKLGWVQSTSMMDMLARSILTPPAAPTSVPSFL